MILWDGKTEIGPAKIAWDGGVIQDVVQGRREKESGQLSVIPGLIDTHVHLVHDAGDRDQSPAMRLAWGVITPEHEQVLHGAANALRALRGGVTTLFDKAADERQVAISHIFDQGIMPGPRVYTNCSVGMTGGHGDLFTPPAVTHRRHLADGVDECRKLVRYWARTGSDAIKITTSGGVLSVGDRNGWRNYTRAEVAAIIDESHALGMQVAAHAHTEDGIQTALDEGVDGLEHATAITEQQAKQAADHGVTIGPTLVILDKLVSGERPANPEQLGKALELHRNRRERLRAALSQGVIFRLATDSGGYRLAFEAMEELRSMCDTLGMSPEDALRAGTSVAADAMKLGDRVGHLTPGLGADFVVIRGRPWQDISQLQPDNIVAVVCRGQVVQGALP